MILLKGKQTIKVSIRKAKTKGFNYTYVLKERRNHKTDLMPKFTEVMERLRKRKFIMKEV